MSATPTPDEARQALEQVGRQRARSAEAATHPRWMWIAGGFVVALWGVLADQAPAFTRQWGNALTILLLLAVVAGNTRWGGSLFGRQVRPRVALDPASMIWFALVVLLFIGGSLVANARHAPHVALWAGLAGGLLLALAGPWWQRRVLTRGARR